MPLEKGKEAMSRNIAKLRKEGYGEKQALAIAYRQAGEAVEAGEAGRQNAIVRNWCPRK